MQTMVPPVSMHRSVEVLSQPLAWLLPIAVTKHPRIELKGSEVCFSSVSEGSSSGRSSVLPGPCMVRKRTVVERKLQEQEAVPLKALLTV